MAAAATVGEAGLGMHPALAPVKLLADEETGARAKDAAVGGVGLRRNETAEPVSPAGRMFASPKTYAVILCILRFRDPVDLPAFRATLTATLLNHKRFSSIMRDGGWWWRPSWERVDVDVEAHVRAASLPSPPLGEDPVEAFAAALATSPPFDRSRPLWEALVVDPGRGGAAVFRIHHSLGDGVSLMSLLLACTRRAAPPHGLPTIPGRPGSVAAADAGSVGKEAVAEGRGKKGGGGVLALLWWLLAVMANTVTHVTAFTTMVLAVRDSKTIFKASPGSESGPRRLATSADIPLEDVALVRRCIDGTINDVLLAMVVGGMRLYMERRAAKEAAASGSGKAGTLVPRKPLVRGLALANLRPAPGLQELQAMLVGKSQAAWGNRLGYVMLALPLQPFDDPMERARRIKRMCDGKKRSLEAAASFFNGRMVLSLFGTKAAASLTYRAVAQTSVLLSNVVGPAEEVMLSGNPITAITPTVAGMASSLVMHLQSYQGSAKVVALAAEAYVPDPAVLCRCCEEAFAEMKAAAIKAAPVPVAATG
eukprot:SM000020S06072  [mRNA]  locus=s20:940673:943199:+ [translate_table: standard]